MSRHSWWRPAVSTWRLGYISMRCDGKNCGIFNTNRVHFHTVDGSPRGFSSQGFRSQETMGGENYPPNAADTADHEARSYLDSDDIAQSYWHLVEQDRSAWALELGLRPHVETF